VANALVIIDDRDIDVLAAIYHNLAGNVTSEERLG
jgi:hypothetical protein